MLSSISDRHYRWIVVVYSLLIQAVSVGVLVYCFALFVLPWLDEFEVGRADVMITISVLQIGMGFAGPLVGRILDRYSMRYVIVAGVTLLAAGLWLVQRATELWQIWLIYGTLMPLSTVMMGTLASQTLVTKWFTQQRGLALGVSAMGTNIGGIVFPWLVAGWLLEWQWRETFSHLSWLVWVLVVPLTFIVLQRSPPEAKASGAVVTEKLWQSREILRTRLFWLPFLSLVPLNMGFGALQFNLGVFSRDLGLDGEMAAKLIMISSACMLTGKLFFGGLGDRVDHRFLYWSATLLLTIATLFLLFTDSTAGLVLAVIFMGLSGGAILPLMGVIFGARFGAASFGRVMGFVMVNVMLGGLAPVIAGWVYDVTASYDGALIGLLVLVVPSCIAMWWLPAPQSDAT